MPDVPAAGGTKRALLIGIDKYVAPKIPQLTGCVNDLRLVRSILQEQFGFPAANVAALTDGDATRDAVLAAFDALVAATGVDDLVVIYYAGHGSQMTDREGDKPSGYDSTIMPVDSEGWSGLNRDITDDEIHLRLAALGAKTAYTTLVVDACHSGTITRDAFALPVRGVPADTRPVDQLPPSPIPAADRAITRGVGAAGPSGWAPLANQYVLIAGCRDEELASEYRPPEAEGAVAHGALTYFLGQELRQATSGTSYRDVFERAAARVTANNARQHPQLEGRADRAVFGVAELQPMQYARVLSRAGDVVTLAAGAAQGMTVGSTWAVYPQGAKTAVGVEPLGTVVVSAVRAVDADARVTAETAAGSIGADARAVEREHAFGTLRLKVQVVIPPLPAGAADDSDVQGLQAALAASRLVEVVAADQPAQARVYRLDPRPGAIAGDAVPQLGAVAARTWAVVGQDGGLLMPPKASGDYVTVRDNLELIARSRQALALENPDPAGALRGKFALELLRRGADGAWIAAQPEGAGGLPVFEEGEAIAFALSSRHDRRAFINLVDFGPTGSVSLIFPPPNAADELEAGVSIQIGTRPGQSFALSFPDGFPFAGAADSSGEAVESVKLFVTTAQADFRFLQQAGTRGDDGPPSTSPLQLLWQTAAGRAPTRDITTTTMPVASEDWTTVVRPFVLRRKSAVAVAGDGAPVALGTATLVTSGVSAQAAALGWGTARADAPGVGGDILGAALDDAGAEVRQTVAVADARPAAGGAPTRDASAPPAGVARLSVPDPGPDYGQMVVRTDALGAISWHFAADSAVSGAGPATRGGDGPGAPATRTYDVPLAVAPNTPDAAGAAPDGRTRGVLGAAAGAAVKQFLKVVVFPRIDPLVGAVAEDYALKWEGKNRPYRVRTFAPDDYAAPAGADLDADAWRALGAGRALLMVHGTFSRTHTAFGALPRDFVASLHERYGGRVFAFDHFTLSHDPRANVDAFLDRMPADAALELDVVCHSRGGLVSRVLAERQGELSLGARRLAVRKVVFVASPNAGTTLADPEHVAAYLDTVSTVLNLIPSAGATEVLSGVVTVAKMLAVGAAKGLPGLMAMQPAGEFAKALNAGARSGDARYFALASNYSPSAPGLRALLEDRLMDKVFAGTNDLVVPTDGVFAQNGSGYFPIEDKFVFDGTSGVAHTEFFASRAARDKIVEWLVA